MSDSRSGAVLGCLLILFGCITNVITLELITKRDSGAGNLLTFSQFVFVACEGFAEHWKFPFGGFRARAIPLAYYAKLTAIFWILSVINNKALEFGISIPLHTVFRSCSLAASLVVGLVVYKNKYNARQIGACALVTLGIIMATLADAHMKQQAKQFPSGASTGVAAAGAGAPGCCGPDVAVGTIAEAAGVVAEEAAAGASWAVGISMLTVALVLSALLGHMQDQAYKRYGKAWKENMFWSHFLALPGFLLVAPDILAHARLWATEPGVSLGSLLGLAPLVGLEQDVQVSLWLLLVANLVLQWFCIKGVFLLTSATSTLTCTLFITLRKFISLVLSVAYFNNPFTPLHWAGTVLVFIGIIIYGLPSGPSRSDSKTAAAVSAAVGQSTSREARDAEQQPAAAGAANVTFGSAHTSASESAAAHVQGPRQRPRRTPKDEL